MSEQKPTAAEARIIELERALEQYADGKNWVASYKSDLSCGFYWIGDGGGPELAQRALEGDKGEAGE